MKPKRKEIMKDVQFVVVARDNSGSDYYATCGTIPAAKSRAKFGVAWTAKKKHATPYPDGSTAAAAAIAVKKTAARAGVPLSVRVSQRVIYKVVETKLLSPLDMHYLKRGIPA